MDPMLIDLPFPLSTARLELRSPQPGDGPALQPVWVESMTTLRQFLAFLPWVAREPTVESAELYCRTAQANGMARKDFSLLMFERTTGRLVGGAGLHRPNWEVPKVEVGYWVRTSAAGQGYATEAVEALVTVAFHTFSAVRVELITDAANQASRRVADRCHFKLEGIMRHEFRGPDGTLRDTCLYARLPATV
jgi:RimJ/RimL family protein N-acetyltransferase